MMLLFKNNSIIIKFYSLFICFFLIFKSTSSSSSNSIAIKLNNDLIEELNNQNFKYTCNVDQYAKLNINSPNYCQFPNGQYTETCLKINDCITSFGNLKILNNNSTLVTLVVNLVNGYYGYDGNCDLQLNALYSSSGGSGSGKNIVFTQYYFQTSNSSLMLIDCQGKGSFIKSSQMSIAITGFKIANTINSAITSNSFGSTNTASISLIAITQMNFINCSNGIEGEGGGAVSIYYPNSVTILYSSFTNCTSNRGVGGAIYSRQTTQFVIRSSTFINCSAEFGGGAIYGQSIIVKGGTFINCNSNLNGGAIQTDISMIDGSTFRNNTAYQNGGAIYTVQLDSENSFYFNNQASTGGIGESSNSGSDGSYSGDSDGSGGGAIYLHDSIKSNLITNNKIFNNIGSNGGGIYIYSPSGNSNLNLTGSEIYENQATEEGGGVYFNSTGSPYLYNGKIYNNTAYITTTAIQLNQRQQQIACDSKSYVNCNLCSSSTCNQCQLKQGICIQVIYDSSGIQQLYGNGTTNSSGSSSEEDDIFCLISKYGCYNGKCNLNRNDDFTCKCNIGNFGNHCKPNGDSSSNSESLSTSSSDDRNKSNHSSESNANNSNNNNSGNNRQLILEITLPIVLGVLILIFFLVLYLVLKRKDQIPDEINHTIYDQMGGSFSGVGQLDENYIVNQYLLSSSSNVNSNDHHYDDHTL